MGCSPIPPQAEDKEVIAPPPIGDEDIHTQAPNPQAGHEEEVIPPPAPGEEPNVKPGRYSSCGRAQQSAGSRVWSQKRK